MNDTTQKTEAEAIRARLAEDAKADAAAVEKAAAKAQAKAEADAKAKAEAQAQAAAAVTDAEKVAPKKRGKKAGAEVASAAHLRELIAMIETRNTGTQRLDLIHQLETEQGAKLTPEAHDQVKLELGGIARTAPTEAKALELWCNAARRACLNGSAA